MRHEIILSCEKEEDEPFLCFPFSEWIARALEEENILLPCEVNVLLTDDGGIRGINLEQRGIDAPTDVLSFPMFELEAGRPPACQSYLDPESGRMPLGDIVLSAERAKEQARAYGHALKRELSYLTIHSVLHLLGYDHTDEGAGRRRMREREEFILKKLHCERLADEFSI